VVEADRVRAELSLKLSHQRHEVDAADRLGLVRDRHLQQPLDRRLGERLEVRREDRGDTSEDAGLHHPGDRGLYGAGVVREHDEAVRDIGGLLVAAASWRGCRVECSDVEARQLVGSGGGLIIDVLS